MCIYIYIHNGILISHKKSEIMPPAATWMDLEMTILSEVSQTQKTNIWNLKKKKKIDTNEFIDKTETDSQKTN